MRTVRIGDVTIPVTRARPAGLFRYIDLGAVDHDRKEIVGDRLLAVAPSRARQPVAAGDVLVATVRPNLNGVAVVPERLNGATASTGFCVLRPTGDLDSRYLFHWVRSPGFVAALTGRATGQAYPAVTDRVVKDLAMPLPALPEQRRVAALLDRVDTLRNRRESAMTELATVELVEPVGETVAIGEICQVRGGKRLPAGARYSPTPTPHRYIRVTDLRDGRIAEGNLRHLTPETQRAIARYTVDADDVIISITGTVGAVALVTDSVAGANLTENAARLKPRTPSRYLPRYLAHLLRTAHVQGRLRRLTGQATVGKLALFRIGQLRVPLPPVQVQEELVARLAKVDHLRELHLCSLQLFTDLYATLRDQEFGAAPPLTPSRSGRPGQ